MKPANVKVTLHFWNNDLGDKKNTCWNAGQASVQVGQNPDHNIKVDNAELFNHPEDMLAAVMDSLHRAGIVVHATPRKRKAV